MSAPANNCLLHSATTHVFLKPWCEQLSSVKKVIIFVGHFFTAGVFFLLAHVISCFSSNRNLKEKALQSVKLDQYPTVGRQAIEFALGQLDTYPRAKKESHLGFDEDNPLVSRLHTIYWHHLQKLKHAVYQHQDDPWNNQEVIDRADAVMKITYAISCLTLNDLPKMLEKYRADFEQHDWCKERGGWRPADQLVHQDYYSSWTFFDCTKTYHLIRGEVKWNDQNNGLAYDYSSPISKSHEASFYALNTRQSKWRELYNDFCQRASKVPGLEEADGRFINWTQVDTGPKSFDRKPDTLPT